MRKQNFLIVLIVFNILGSMVAFPTDAQEKTAIDSQGALVIVNGKKFDARKDDTTTKIVVTKEELQKFGDMTVADALKRQSGITVQGSSIRLLGLNGYTQVLLDGQPLPNGMSTDNINPNRIERIEIVRSATADLSTQAIAGTINIISVKHVTSLTRRLKLSVNRFGKLTAFNEVYVQLADKKNGFTYDVSGSMKRAHLDIESEKINENTVNSVQRIVAKINGYDRAFLQGAPRFEWASEDRSDVFAIQNDLLFLSRVQERNADGYNLGANSTLFTRQKSRTESEESMLQTKLIWTHKFGSDGELKLNLGIGRGKSSANTNDVEKDASGRILINRFSDFSNVENELTFSGNITQSLNKEHTFKSGLDFGRNLYQNSDSITNTSIEETGLSTNRLALFAQDEWITTPNWSNYYGLRWEGFRTNISSKNADSIENTTSVFSPIAQSRWKFLGSKENQVRVALARTFRNPRLRELAPNRRIEITNNLGTPDNIANPNLRPEISLGFNAAFEHFGKDGLNMTASIYHRRISDMITENLSEVNGRWQRKSINDGDAKAFGFLGDLRLPLSLILKEAKQIDLTLNFARNWSSVNNVPGPNNRLAQQARMTFNLGANYKPHDKLSTGINYTFNSGDEFQISRDVVRFVSARKDLDIFALWKMEDNLNIRLAFSNILGTQNPIVYRYADQQLSRESTARPRGFSLNLEKMF